jgi:hypothetical protein
MTDATRLEVYRAHREAQNRYTYFVLAAAGAAIAFAITKTEGLPLAWRQGWVGAAVLCWGLSFFFGCRHLNYISSSLYANAELLTIQAGEHRLTGQRPEMIKAASQGIIAAIESNGEKANRFAKWQFRLLIAGSLFYVAWHVSLMMAVRRP